MVSGAPECRAYMLRPLFQYPMSPQKNWQMRYSQISQKSALITFLASRLSIMFESCSKSLTITSTGLVFRWRSKPTRYVSVRAMSEQYITISELLIFAAIWLSLPIALAGMVQLALYRYWGVLQRRTVIAIVGYLAVIIFSPVLGYIGLISNFSVPSWLGPTSNMLIHPLAFLSVGVAVAAELLLIYWYSRYVQKL